MLFADVFGSFKCRKRRSAIFFAVAELCCSVHRFRSGKQLWRSFAPPCGDYRPRMQWMCTVFMLVCPPSQLTYEAVCSTEVYRTRDAGYEDKPPIQTANHSVSVDLGVVTRH